MNKICVKINNYSFEVRPLGAAIKIRSSPDGLIFIVASALGRITITPALAGGKIVARVVNGMKKCLHFLITERNREQSDCLPRAPAIKLMFKKRSLPWRSFCYDEDMKNLKIPAPYRSLTIALILSPALYGLLYSLININNDGGAGFYKLFFFILFVPGIMSIAYFVQAIVHIRRYRTEKFYTLPRGAAKHRHND